ncbi:unnamed protein product [Rhodiola kirilowii]
MEREAFYHDVPCSSIAVESAIRVGTAGAIWGLCSGPYDATKQGLSGLARASFVAKSIGGIGLQCGFLAGLFSMTRCSVQRYRRKDDWMNSCIAGAVTGSAVASRTRSWKNVAQVAGLVSVFSVAADYTKVL